MEISAYSEDGIYRYLSEEQISDSSNLELLVVMLNPATTLESSHDPNRRRQTRSVMKNAALRWEFGVLVVVNLFAFRAKNAQLLFQASDPNGPGNDTWIRRAVKRVDRVVVAWGNRGSQMNRSADVLALVQEIRTPSHMGKTQTGEPLQPRGWRKRAVPTPWES